MPFLCCNRVSKGNYSDFVPIWIFWRLANLWCTTINYVNRCNEYLGLTDIISEIILELILDAHWLLMKARWNLNADTELDACPPKARWNLNTYAGLLADTGCLLTDSKMNPNNCTACWSDLMLIMRAFAVKIRELRGCVKRLDGLCCQDQRNMREKVLNWWIQSL